MPPSFARHALTGLLAAAAVRSAAAQSPDTVRHPEIASIAVTPTVARFHWNDCPEYCDTPRWRAWTFSRATGAWASSTPRRTAPAITRRQPSYDTTKSHRLDGTFRLAFTGLDGHEPNFEIRASDGRRHPLRPTVSAAERWRAVAHYRPVLRDLTRDAPPFATSILTWVTGADAIWFGLQGHYTRPGGLLRFDRRTRQVDAMLDSLVSRWPIVEMAVSRSAVWMAADSNYGGMRRRGIGLLRYDPSTRNWKSFTAATSPLPDDDVLMLEATGDTVWIATRTGVAVLDDATGRWSVRHMRAMARVDSITDLVPGSGHTDEDGNRRFESASRPVIVPRWRLVPDAPADDARERAIVALGRKLQLVDERSPFAASWLAVVGDPDSLIAIMRSIPSVHFDSAWQDEQLAVDRVLAHPRLLPYAAASIHFEAGGVSWEDDAVRALGLARDRRHLPVLRKLLADASEPSPSIGFALARFGDSTGLAILRDGFARGMSGYSNREIRDRLVELGDTSIVPLLAARAQEWDGGGESVDIYRAISRVATVEQWRDIVRDATMRSDGASAALLSLLAWQFPTTIAGDAESRASVTALARTMWVARSPTREDPYVVRTAFENAAKLLTLLRDTAAIPDLIDALTDVHRHSHAIATLIELTGVEASPVPPEPTAEQRTQAQRFWAEWWSVNRRSFVPVAPEVGTAALRRWRERWLSR